MERLHYLGKGPLCGAQIRYLVKSSRYGWVGALAFSAAQWRLHERDKYIGWTEAARRANLNRVVCNSRFLILPERARAQFGFARTEPVPEQAWG